MEIVVVKKEDNFLNWLEGGGTAVWSDVNYI